MPSSEESPQFQNQPKPTQEVHPPIIAPMLFDIIPEPSRIKVLSYYEARKSELQRQVAPTISNDTLDAIWNIRHRTTESQEEETALATELTSIEGRLEEQLFEVDTQKKSAIRTSITQFDRAARLHAAFAQAQKTELRTLWEQASKEEPVQKPFSPSTFPPTTPIASKLPVQPVKNEQTKEQEENKPPQQGRRFIITPNLPDMTRLRIINALKANGIPIEDANRPPTPQPPTTETLEEALERVKNQPPQIRNPLISSSNRETRFVNLTQEQEVFLRETLIFMGIPPEKIQGFPPKEK